ncbi:MAG: NAD-glutamate dehydrogenase [Planctomycetota bacterium]
MITADPARRSAMLAEIEKLLAQQARPDQRDVLLAFARIAFTEMPDQIALKLDAAALAARVRQYFAFVAETPTPQGQEFHGVPGLHVAVHNLNDAEEAVTGRADAGARECTIVETHTPDAPFLFESLKNFFLKEGLHVFSAVHPMFRVRRQWERITWVGNAREDGSCELFCQFRIERVEAPERLRQLEQKTGAVLKSVFLATEDASEMGRTVRSLHGELRARRAGGCPTDTTRAFLDWLLADNYVMLGMQRYRVQDGVMRPDPGHALGAFRDPQLVSVVFPGLALRQGTRAQAAAGDDRLVDIDYCTGVSAIHHLEPLDDIAVRIWSSDGSLKSVTFLLGRLAQSALAAKPEDIPLLKEKFDWIAAHSGAMPNSHASRETRAIFNHFPKRELFYADAEALKGIIDQMVYMASDDEIAIGTREGHGYTAVCLAFSDLRYSRKAEEELKQVLADTFGPISYHTWEDCGNSGVLVYYFDHATLEKPIDPERVRELAAAVITTWEDRVAVELEQAFGRVEGRRLFKRYVRLDSRSGLYRETTRPEEVPGDVRRFENLERLDIAILPETDTTVLLKIFSPRRLELTETLRTLQNLSLLPRDELSMPLALPERRVCHLSRLRVDASKDVIASMIAGEERLRDALRALQDERATEDSLNGLVLLQGLTWREVEILRTLRNHLLQIHPAYNADTINSVLLRNSTVAAKIFRMFVARFDPAVESGRDQRIRACEEDVRQTLKTVANIVDDEILRALDNLVRAGVRTNFFTRPERAVFSIKVDSARVEGMVSPRPLYEIYVHSRLVEGIHLRGGKVARGGIRWSDRHDDFRTEILGLMKTQMLKNSVIVPVGSKGGFVLKGNVPPRPALDQYLIDRYRQFISGLLDLTDNLVDGSVAHPPRVVFHDQDDPYLVVAADKGTAHLSDTANQVSAQYGFWLGDAFASGGSVGYDHKKEAITARGAWECVIHHFRRLGVDVQTQPFTATGIGDMSGDVFGNGLLRSESTKLVAAFDHRHIFLDPNPDPRAGFAERKRLFELPRSTWKDYNAKLISKGGGVFERGAKSIQLSPEARRLLKLEREEASGEEVIRHILMADADLLYNGGIGTYVKSSSEEDADVGDRTNDRVRVNADQVRAKVIAEGGNLGLTQRARIEYFLRGGMVNTDAIDNSGGVDMSDHEVNIKILLEVLLQSGAIKDRNERNALLRAMTDEVSELVLADNRNQARALTLDGMRSAARYEEFVDLIENMVTTGLANRADDALPTRDELLALPRERGIPRPALAVLLARTKNWVFREAMKTPLTSSALGTAFLHAYFPKQLRDRHAQHFGAHPLKGEIIATVAVNQVVNHTGIATLARIMANTQADLGRVLMAYLDVDRQARGAELRERVLSPGKRIEVELEALLAIEDALESAAVAALGGKSDATHALSAVQKRLAL